MCVCDLGTVGSLSWSFHKLIHNQVLCLFALSSSFHLFPVVLFPAVRLTRLNLPFPNFNRIRKIFHKFINPHSKTLRPVLKKKQKVKKLQPSKKGKRPAKKMLKKPSKAVKPSKKNKASKLPLAKVIRPTSKIVTNLRIPTPPVTSSFKPTIAKKKKRPSPVKLTNASKPKTTKAKPAMANSMSAGKTTQKGEKMKKQKKKTTEVVNTSLLAKNTQAPKKTKQPGPTKKAGIKNNVALPTPIATKQAPPVTAGVLKPLDIATVLGRRRAVEGRNWSPRGNSEPQQDALAPEDFDGLDADWDGGHSYDDALSSSSFLNIR